MLTKLGRRMDEHSENFNKDIGKIQESNSHRAEEDSNGTKKHTGEVQQQTRSRSTDPGTQGQSNGTHPVKAAKKR